MRSAWEKSWSISILRSDGMTEWLYLKDIKPNPNDPRRKRRESFVKQLAESIKREGLLHPILVNQDKTLVDGHYRLEALKLLGFKRLCWDKEKRIATLPRDKDFDTSFDSGAANFLVEPQTSLDKAIYINHHIQTKILNNLPQTSVANPKAYLQHCKDVYYKEGRKLREELKAWEEERIHILNAAKSSLAEAPELLDMLEWPEFLQDAIDDEKITLSYGMELARLPEEKIQKKLLEAILKQKFKVGEVRKWVSLIREDASTEKLLDQVIKVELDKKGRDIILKTAEQTIKMEHKLTEDEIGELVEFAEVEQESDRKWTDIKVKQATDALLEGKLREKIVWVTDADNRLLDDYASYRENIYGIVADHIKYGFSTDEAKKQAIAILWDVHNHIEKQLRELNEISISVVRRE